MATITATTSTTVLPQVPNPSLQSTGSLPSISSQTPQPSSATTSSSSTIPRGPVKATLNFYDPPSDGSAPHNWVEAPPAGQPQRNFGDSLHEITISDVRGREDSFNLDTHAFAVLKNFPHNDAIDWSSDDSIREVYYPEVEALLLKECPGAERILLFDHTIRKALPNAHRAPVTRAHIDQTPKSATQRVSFHCPDEAANLLQGRYRIINVWRPLNGPVESFPLAFADSTTVPDTDMVGVEHRYPDRTGETAAIRFNEKHEWHYWSGVGEDERILLQCFDSAAPMNRVPHSAFVDPRTTEASKPRESIEVRALIFG